MRTYPNQYPIYIALRVSPEQWNKIQWEMKKGKSQSEVIRELIDKL